MSKKETIFLASKKVIFKKSLFFFCFFGVITAAFSQESIASKLGYSADTRLLIIHADDLGVAHSENRASIKAIEEGSVNSASVMMPTPWVMEAANYAKENSETHDFGLHLVLSSEWKNYKWGPVTSKDKVLSLIDEHGYFHNECKSEVNIEEVETELRAQIDRAYAMGLIPTHLDTHMGCLVQTQELMEVYLKMGQEYKLPVLASKMFPPDLLEKYDVRIVLEDILTIMPEQYEKGTVEYYTEAIKNLKPGLSTFLIHTAYDDEELKGMTIEHPDWGNAWRQKDYDFFTSESCKMLLEKENIQLVTWRQLKDAYFTDP
ncbi:polysaccharide deacetylase family protein [Lutimonas zeaxanthinifaciens]|uniref:polysaccharide deacetylase family protein n=1 Tax=Lutimonas zeaxanthinifaciens TaxID=3060215 RepID=UPI00265D2BA0|nr:polysaccharide deacetylase family protein [Lutimonas sp. YSD2104]WKK65679.1 polysaccharide deacetylase family protein [Lutimonas sp. YSD2104]